MGVCLNIGFMVYPKVAIQMGKMMLNMIEDPTFGVADFQANRLGWFEEVQGFLRHLQLPILCSGQMSVILWLMSGTWGN